MHAKHAPLGEPALALLLDEFPDPFGLDEFQVLDFADAVFCPIALIEMSQSIARKFRACAAKSALALPANAKATLDACFGSILLGKTAPAAGIAFSQMRLADGAIDPTGSDEAGIKLRLHPLLRTRHLG